LSLAYVPVQNQALIKLGADAQLKLLIAVKDRCDDQSHKDGMTRYLVVYCSWTGNTKSIAKVVAGRLGADVEEVIEQRP
jgi:hypothetical protein